MLRQAAGAVEGRAGRDPSIAVVWTSKTAAGTVLVSARSADGGKSFVKPALVAGTDAAGNRGWQSIATDAGGNVVVFWLDHRDVPSAGAHGGHGEHKHSAPARGTPAKADGVARAQLSRLYFTRLDQKGGPQGLTGGVCYCCKTSVATRGTDRIYAAWRHVYPGNMRDIAFTMSRDGGKTFAAPARVSEDGWSIDGCPENGPALAVDDAGRIHVVWPTMGAGDVPMLFYAMSDDGQSFSRRRQIPTTGMPRHPQIAVRNGRLMAVWDEAAEGASAIAFAMLDLSRPGRAGFARELAPRVAGTYPVVAATDDAMVMAWVSGPSGRNVLRVRRVESR